VIEAENGSVALDLIKHYEKDLAAVLLDIVMPLMDGFGVLKEMNDTGIINSVPVVMITGEDDDEKALSGYSMGVSDLIKKPFNSDIVYRRVNNIIDLYAHKQNLEQKLKEQRELLEKQNRRLEQSNLYLIDALSTTVEFRNLESGEHIKRIRYLTRILLEQMSLVHPFSPQEVDAISNASAVHDIGKIAIPDSILLKPGALTKEEFEIMKTHTVHGCDIISSFNYIQDQQYYMYCYQICRHHHERWDGKGYPDGLAGDEISIWAQVTSLADVYDALTSKRVYKDAYVHNEAVEMILRGECGVFNPKLLDCFVKLQDNLTEKIRLISAHESELFNAEKSAAALN
jgi:putative two-component system response regulator